MRLLRSLVAALSAVVICSAAVAAQPAGHFHVAQRYALGGDGVWDYVILDSIGNRLSSNGDGTLTVVHEDARDRFRVIETVATMPGARTMALDPRSHRLCLVSARFGPAPTESTAANPRRRPPIVPGSFTLLVLEQ